jgi:hypothetical protein
MKKALVLGILGVAAAATQSFGQGQLNFANYYSSTQTSGISYATGPTGGVDAGLLVGPEISAVLLAGPAGSTMLSQLSPVAGSMTQIGLGVASAPGTPGAGWFAGGKVTINGGVAGNYSFAIEASGMDHSMAFIGDSPIVDGPTTASSTSPLPNLPDALYKGSFTVHLVPEPSVLALSGVGLAALMLRRKK